MRTPIVSLGSATAVALTLALAAPAAHADKWERGYNVTGTPSLVVRSDDGSIHVAPGAAGRVEIGIETRGWRIRPRELEIEATQTGRTIELEVRTPRRLFEFNLSPRWIRIEVRVPPASDLDLHSGDGSIAIESVKGAIKAGTGDGSITVDALSGDLRLRTGDGRITGTHLDGRLVASTGDGRIRIDGRFDALELRSGDGSVVAEAGAGSKMADDWALTTGDGAMSLAIPRDLAADLDVHTGDGRIDVDMPVTVEGRFSRSTLRGTLNGGGPLLRVRSGDGSIRIGRSL